MGDLPPHNKAPSTWVAAPPRSVGRPAGEPARGTASLAAFIGQAPAVRKALDQVARLANSDAGVLIGGETGTGKELIARAIHYLSHRANFPFVPVNCGSLPDTLLEAELFGHERGAYTDARSKRQGLISVAARGTLFLDEVDSLSLKAQVALLRILEDKRFRAVGSSIEQDADVRIVSATNTDLESRVRAGSFRADLFYRLRIFWVHLPPLRERREDILPLAAHFIHKHGRRGVTLELSPDARDTLLSLEWPGNVRELENAIIRGCQMCDGNHIECEDLGLPPPAELPPEKQLDSGVLQSFGLSKKRMIADFERKYLTQLITEHAGNVSRAARAAGKERRELGKLLKKHHLDPKQFSSNDT